MSPRDPIDILEGITDADIDPDPAFGERLLDDMLLSLAPDSIALPPGPVIAVSEAGSLPVLDLVSQTNEGTDHMNRKRATSGVLLAAAAIALILGLFVSIDGDDDLQTVPAATTNATTPTTTTAPVFGAEDALAVADEFFAATNAGDFDALLALFVADPAVTTLVIGRDEDVFAWDVGQGTTITEPDCTVTGEITAESIKLRCEYFNRDALVQAVDGPQVPITTILTVTPNGISRTSGAFGQPDFDAVYLPFERWMDENHPEDVNKVGFIEWASVEQAEAYGALRIQYGTEWATYLETNGCGYDDGC